MANFSSAMCVRSPQFVLFTFYNTKEKEQSLYFCQWNGNEKVLTAFHSLSTYIPDDVLILDHDALTFTSNIDTKFSEELVDGMLRIDTNATFNTFSPLITKCWGRFLLPGALRSPAVSSISNYDRIEYVFNKIQQHFYPSNFHLFWDDYRSITPHPKHITPLILDNTPSVCETCVVEIKDDSITIAGNRFFYSGITETDSVRESFIRVVNTTSDYMKADDKVRINEIMRRSGIAV